MLSCTYSGCCIGVVCSAAPTARMPPTNTQVAYLNCCCAHHFVALAEVARVSSRVACPPAEAGGIERVIRQVVISTWHRAIHSAPAPVDALVVRQCLLQFIRVFGPCL